MFTFGHICLCVAVQKHIHSMPAAYRNSATDRLVARTEVERREGYFRELSSAIDEEHPLV